MTDERNSSGNDVKRPHEAAAGGNVFINYRGGDIVGPVRLAGGVLNIFGSGLSVTPVASSDPLYQQCALPGKLTDGTSIAGESLFVFNGSGGTYTFNNGVTPSPLVPEPGAFAFGVLAVGSVLGLIARRRK